MLTMSKGGLEFDFQREVYYYNKIDCSYSFVYLIILNMADIRIDNEENYA